MIMPNTLLCPDGAMIIIGGGFFQGVALRYYILPLWGISYRSEAVNMPAIL